MIRISKSPMKDPYCVGPMIKSLIQSLACQVVAWLTRPPSWGTVKIALHHPKDHFVLNTLRAMIISFVVEGVM
jgi:hypothetical protein